MTTVSDLNAALDGRYLIEGEIGRGGMATVYRARDLRHHRLVALKVLSPDLAAVLGAERFLSEIRVTANLQHPNLLPLFDSGDANGQLFYVMPFVEGESLRGRLDREKQLPIEQAIRMAVAMAEALDYAHRQGVIHRDLKPENILLREGQPLIADFGIALAVSNAGGARVTQTGISLGTPQYMSPEQATGDRAVDARSDIYSLATVTFEMLTGETPHTGTSAQAIIAKLITEPPRSLTSLRRSIPEHVELAVLKALEKLPADRFTSAREFATALTDPSVTRNATVAGVAPRTDRRRPSWTLTAVIGLTMAVVGAAASRVLAPAPARTVIRVPLALPDTIAAIFGGRPVLALSPAGDRLALSTRRTGPIIVVGLEDPVARAVVGTVGGTAPAFSPDGRELAFMRGTTVYRVPVEGGTAVAVADSVTSPVWSDRGSLFVFRRRGEVLAVRPGETHPERVVTLDSATAARMANASPLPDERYLLADWQAPGLRKHLVLVELATGHVDSLGVIGSNPRYSRTGHIVYADSTGMVMAITFSSRSRRVSGTPIVIGPRSRSNGLGSAAFAISQQGTMVEFPDEGAAQRQMMVVSRTGDVRVVSSDLRSFAWLQRSPDGKRVAVEINAGSAGPWATWAMDLTSGVLSRVNKDGTGARPQGWSSDGRRIYYLSAASTAVVVSQPWDGSGPPVEALRMPAGITQGSIDRSGRLYVAKVGTTMTVATLDSSAPARVLVDDPSLGSSPQISPDGTFVTYTSSESGRVEVYVRDIAGVAGRIRVSMNGGEEPLWSHDGTAVFYRDGGTVRRANIARAPALKVAQWDSLFTSNDYITGSMPWAVLPDDQHFVMLKDLTPQPHPLLVMGWTRLFRTPPSP